MKNEYMTIILILALAITLVSNAMFNGMPPAKAEDGTPPARAEDGTPPAKAEDGTPPAKAEDSKNGQDNKGQVNTERQQINRCVKNTPYKDQDCNNVFVYGVVCMPGSTCKLERFDIPFDLVTPH
jgi:hypothetical protein